MAVLVILGVVGLPTIVRGQLEARLSEALGREVAVGKVRLNPLALSGAVEAFEIKARDGSRWLGWERLYVNFEAWSLVSGEWRFSEIDLVGFDGHAHLGADGCGILRMCWRRRRNVMERRVVAELARPGGRGSKRGGRSWWARRAASDCRS